VGTIHKYCPHSNLSIFALLPNLVKMITGIISNSSLINQPDLTTVLHKSSKIGLAFGIPSYL